MPLPILPDLLVPLDPARPEPIHRQLYRGIREAILAGGLPAGVRIPSTRRLAEQLGISRSTVLVAFDQLVAEGYLVGAVGSGSYVARDIPQHLRRSPVPGNGDERPKSPRVAARVARVARAGGRAVPAVPYPNAFWSGVPPIDVFPMAAWNRIVARRLRSLEPADLHHGPAAGYRPLREAIAAYLVAARGMRCSADQVIVLASAQEALELAARVLLDPGDAAWMEEPGWSGARGAFVSADIRIVPVPVDADGLDVAAGLAAAPDARAVYLSPSHQYPLGATLGLERRMALLDWAARSGAWLIEDDYDSEFRYSGRPLTALHGLDSRGSVIYVGTFNKTMFPALRVGYLVVPEALVESFLTLRRLG
ncbi:MAG TPA: PLP-dependent aminotransferase family protein, partial [Gemmatimonadales bacterium]|nr:PLP-dependent aminotransferase family protein [Gemmatimonadales bacterium]